MSQELSFIEQGSLIKFYFKYLDLQLLFYHILFKNLCGCSVLFPI